MHAEGWSTLERTKTTQAEPMAIWCLLAVALVMSFVAAGVALFFTSGKGQPIQSKAAPWGKSRLVFGEPPHQNGSPHLTRIHRTACIPESPTRDAVSSVPYPFTATTPPYPCCELQLSRWARARETLIADHEVPRRTGIERAFTVR
jgi:hypothetical protein